MERSLGLSWLWTLCSGEDRGSAWIIDAIGFVIVLGGAVGGAVLITGVAPQEIANPEQNVVDETVEEELEVALAASATDGSLKELTLAWDDDGTVEGWSDGVTPTTVDRSRFIQYPSGNAFGDRLRQIDARHGVSINVRIIPASNKSTPNENPDPIPLIETTEGVEREAVATQSIAIYEQDELQSPASAHSRRTVPVVAGVSSDADPAVVDAGTYPVPESAEMADNEQYNVVTVMVIAYE
jgi:hypothetical protein